MHVGGIYCAVVKASDWNPWDLVH